MEEMAVFREMLELASEHYGSTWGDSLVTYPFGLLREGLNFHSGTPAIVPTGVDCPDGSS